MATPTRPTSRTQRRSPSALHSFLELRELRPFYRSKARLVRALGWRPSTVDAWLKGDVARPRLEHRDQVRRLRELCRKAEAWAVEPQQVGDWTLEAQSTLADRAPSEVLRVLGEEGLDKLLRNFVKIAPRTPVGDPELPSAEQLRTALAQTLDSDTRTLINRAADAAPLDVDLSDFD